MKPRILLQPGELLPEERCWLSGEPLPPGANRFWIYCNTAEQLARREWLVEHFASLIPPSRAAALEADLAQWRRSCGPALQ